jgi:hypothetical protein
MLPFLLTMYPKNGKVLFLPYLTVFIHFSPVSYRLEVMHGCALTALVDVLTTFRQCNYCCGGHLKENGKYIAAQIKWHNVLIPP